jgi:hypothetical protein
MLPAVLLTLALTGPISEQVQPPQQPPQDIALKRIRQGLAVTTPLQIDLPAPTFRMEIRKHLYYPDAPLRWDFSGGGVTFRAPRSGPIGSAPLIQIDLMPIVTAVRKLLPDR